MEWWNTLLISAVPAVTTSCISGFVAYSKTKKSYEADILRIEKEHENVKLALENDIEKIQTEFREKKDLENQRAQNDMMGKLLQNEDILKMVMPFIEKEIKK